MPCKVVGAKLIFGVAAVLDEVFHPLIQEIHMLTCKGHVAGGNGHGGFHDQHIAALLHGHLLFVKQVAVLVAVHLTVEAYLFYKKESQK